MSWCIHEEPKRSCRICNPVLAEKAKPIGLRKEIGTNTVAVRIGDIPPRGIAVLLAKAQKEQQQQRAKNLDRLAELLPAKVYMTDFGIALHASRACLEDAQRRGAEKGLRPGEIRERSPFFALRKKRRPCLNCLPKESVEGLDAEMQELWDTLIKEIPPGQGLLFQ